MEILVDAVVRYAFCEPTFAPGMMRGRMSPWLWESDHGEAQCRGVGMGMQDGPTSGGESARNPDPPQQPLWLVGYTVPVTGSLASADH